LFEWPNLKIQTTGIEANVRSADSREVVDSTPPPNTLLTVYKLKINNFCAKVN